MLPCAFVTVLFLFTAGASKTKTRDRRWRLQQLNADKPVKPRGEETDVRIHLGSHSLGIRKGTDDPNSKTLRVAVCLDCALRPRAQGSSGLAAANWLPTFFFGSPCRAWPQPCDAAFLQRAVEAKRQESSTKEAFSHVLSPLEGEYGKGNTGNVCK